MDQDAIGISLLCDLNGRMTRIMRDDIGISSRLNPGQHFTLLFDSESISKAFSFFSEIKRLNNAFDWELCVISSNVKGCEVLHFAGYCIEDHIFMVGANFRSGVIQFCEDLMMINNEQANAIRSLIKNQIHSSQGQSEIEKKYYEELTWLNSELESTQRQLQKKNLELEKAYAELQHRQEQLIQSEKMASLGRLVSGFAHEINTPIGIAVTASSSLYSAQQAINRMLAQEEVAEEELVSHLEIIDEACQLTLANLKRAAELVKSFKQTSIDQSAETQRLFDIGEVISDVVISLGSKFRPTGIEIAINCPTPINLYGYPGAISQIMTNLLMNSLICGFDDGRLSGQIRIDIQAKNQVLHLDYTDTGQGIDETILKHLFEPFFTSRRAKGGTGLGLYICYNTVTSKLKGTIHCQSAVGKGVVFHIAFPIEKIEP